MDEDSVVFTKLQQTEKYDQGTVEFRARKGKLIDLDKLHESIWATRLSGRTRSGLVSLEVVVIGDAIRTQDAVILKVSGADAEFVLSKGPDEKQSDLFVSLEKAAAGTNQTVKVTGVIDDYRGRWPSLFRKKPTTPRRILVTHFEVLK